MSISPTGSSFAPDAISTSPAAAIGTQNAVLNAQISNYVLKDQINLSKEAVALLGGLANNAAAAQKA